MPKELVGVAPGRLQWREYEDGPVGAGDVRVAAEHAVAKHGTEMSFFKGYANPRGSYDRDLGLFTGEGRADAGYGPTAVTACSRASVGSRPCVGGTVVCGAYPGPYPAGLDLGAEAHFNRPNVVFSRACSDPSRDHPRWDEQRLYRACLRLIDDHRLDGDGVVQPVVRFAHLAEEYPKIADSPETLVKLGVDY
jgi:hypothetical protein